MRNSATSPQEREILVPKIFAPFFEDMRYKVAHGGRGSGKSHSFARMLLLSCLKAPERILCAREYQSSIKDSVKQLLDDIIDEYKLYSYFKSKQGEITGANGSKFLFAGLRHDPHKIKSMEGITKCWLEEANVVSQESLDFLIPTIRDEGSEIWMTFNRQHKSDPVDKMFLGEFKRPDATVARVNFSENPFFPNTLRLEMEWDKSHDIGKYEHIWLGKPVQHSDSLIFHGRYKMDETIIPPKGTPLYYGMDFGFSKDPFAFLRCWIDRSKREIYIDMEAYGIGIEINHLCKYIDAIPGSKHYSIKADSSRPDTISFLKNQGYNIIGSRKGKGSVHDGVEFLKSHTIIVHPRCKHLLDELSLYSYKVDKRTGTVMPDIEDKNNHMMDSLRYALEDFTQGTVEVFVG